MDGGAHVDAQGRTNMPSSLWTISVSVKPPSQEIGPYRIRPGWLHARRGTSRFASVLQVAWELEQTLTALLPVTPSY